jgi:hypothetical protein
MSILLIKEGRTTAMQEAKIYGPRSPTNKDDISVTNELLENKNLMYA